MYSGALLSLGILYVFLRNLILPVITYLRDPKGLRRYSNYSAISGIFDIPFLALSATGSRSKRLTEAHKDQSIIRIGPNSLSFAHPDAIRDIYGHSTSCVKDNKYALTSPEHPHLFDVIDKAKHAEKRKRLSAAFAIKHLEAWEFKVARSTERLLDALDGCCMPHTGEDSAIDSTVDVNYWINLFTIEAINYLALSSDLGLLQQGSDKVVAERLDGTLYEASYRSAQDNTAFAISHFVWDTKNYHALKWLSKLSARWRKIWNDAAPWSDIVYHQAKTRLNRYKKGEELDDFFSALMEDKRGVAYEQETGEIVNEVGAIINAGADTTSIAITQVLDCLARHPDHLGTLREEIDAAVGSQDIAVAEYETLKNLPFLRACLDESLRVSPPTPHGLPRRTPAEGASIMGEWIPGDTTVSMTAYSAHHDAAIFPAPEEFRPQRWLDPEERRRMESNFIPFSKGGRGCLGRNISYLEQLIVVASFVHRYEFELPGGDWKLEHFEAFNLLMGKLPMKIWHRRAS